MRVQHLLPIVLASLLAPHSWQAAEAQDALPVRTIAEFRGFKVWDVVPALGGQRIYYTAAPDEQTDANALWLFDVASGQSTQVASGPMGRGNSLGLSPQADRLAFKRREEGGNAMQLWTLPLDPRTGLATGAARRASVSNTRGGRPSFSPEGDRIAFVRVSEGNEPSLAVVPVNGGAERVLVEGGLSVDLAEWTPEGEWIYFSAWVGDDLVFRRVPATGGEPEEVAVALQAGWMIGISPDGRHVAHEATDHWSAALSDVSGRRIGLIPWADHWVSPTELLDLFSARMRGLKSVTLSDGVVRDVLPPSGVPWDVAWAPDGQRFAAIVGLDLIIAAPEGRVLRTVPLGGDPAPSITWSPDGRSIALVRTAPYGSTRPAGPEGRTPQDLLVVDAETGEVHVVPTAVSYNIGDIHWSQESGRIRYVNGEVAGFQGTAQTVIREAGLVGGDTLLAHPRPAAVGWNVQFVSDSTLFVQVDSFTYVHSLTTGESVLVFSEPNPGSTASASGKLLAMRPPSVPRGSGRTAAAVVTPGGEPVATVDFGMNVGPGASRGFIFTPDERHLITSAAASPGQCCRILAAPLDGGPVRTLVDLLDYAPAGSHGTPVLALSPDGNTLLFTYGGELATQIKIYDIAPMLPSPRPR